jgi:hypothetical protein
MEPYGAPGVQPTAIAGKWERPKNGSDKRKPLPWVAIPVEVVSPSHWEDVAELDTRKALGAARLRRTVAQVTLAR